MESSFTYCSQWVIADCFFLTLVMSSTDVIISCILTNWAGKKRKNSQKYNTVLMSRIFLEKNEPLWVWFLGHEEKWGINSKLGALSSLTCSTYTKIGTIQRRLAWPLRKDDTQNREAFPIFLKLNFIVVIWLIFERENFNINNTLIPPTNKNGSYQFYHFTQLRTFL